MCSSLVNVDREAVFESSSRLLESREVEVPAAEASDSHVSRLVRQVLVAQFARALPSNSIVEWFWLVELLSVLSSVLIGVRVPLGGPARTIPEGRVHDVARAIIK